MQTVEPTYWYEANLGEAYHGEDRTRVDDQWLANLQSSLWTDGFHHPSLDLDVAHTYRPSSTPGHGHLIIDGVALSWRRYKKLLKVLAKAGIIEDGYYRAARRRKATFLRPQWEKKRLEDF